MEFLTGFTCKCEIYPQSLTGRITLVEEGTAAKPLQSKLVQAVIEGVTAALCEISDPFHLILRRTTSGSMEQGSARSTGKSCVRVGDDVPYLLVSTGRIPGTWRH